MNEGKKATCQLCGGNDFYKDNGQYICSQCQTQTQTMQEYEVGNEETKNESRKRKRCGGSVKDKITSWEYYNYVLLGLTEELLELGASESLKPIVMLLWMHYLKKLEVISKSKDALPKVQILNNSVDAEVIYGKPACLFRRKSNKIKLDKDPVLDQSYAKMQTIRNRNKLRKTVVENYVPETSIAANRTLADLKTDISSESSKVGGIKYNSYSVKELLKHQHKNHLKLHSRDYKKELPCHRFSYQNVTRTFRNSAENLSVNKLYMILYLALLINGDEIELADMFRFIKEGHLSYNSYSHFFPEDYLKSSMKFGNARRIGVFVSKTFRSTAMKLAKSLKITKYIPKHNFEMLCDRYCKELNLPDEICQCAKNLLIKFAPKMHFTNNRLLVPNYEGRVLSIIIIVLKLLFGLDGQTEFIFSEYASVLNSCDNVCPKMFDIVAWLKYIEYRKLVLTEHNFPVQFDNDKSFKKTDEFVEFYEERNADVEVKLNKQMENFEQLLLMLKDRSKKHNFGIHFPKTFTPFYEYTQVLLTECIPEQNNYLEDILKQHFLDNSLYFLAKPLDYLRTINNTNEVEIVDGGANENIIFEELIDTKRKDEYYCKQEQKNMFVNLSAGINVDKNLDSIRIPEFDYKIKETKSIIHDFIERHARKFRQNRQKMAVIGEMYDTAFAIEREDFERLCVDGSSFKIYNPHMKYWVKYRFNCETETEFKVFADKMPVTFLTILYESARIAEQSVRELYEEFQLTEAYLIYCTRGRRRETILNNVLEKLIVKAIANW